MPLKSQVSVNGAASRALPLITNLAKYVPATGATIPLNVSLMLVVLVETIP